MVCTRWTTWENGAGIGIEWKTELAAQISDMNSSIFPIILAQGWSIFILLLPVGYERRSSIQFLDPVIPSTLWMVLDCSEASLNKMYLRVINVITNLIELGCIQFLVSDKWKILVGALSFSLTSKYINNFFPVATHGLFASIYSNYGNYIYFF